MPAKVSNFPIIDPSNGRHVRDHAGIDADEAARRVSAAHEAWQTWRHTTFAERSKVLIAAAAALRSNVDTLADRCTREMGKPITESRAEIEKCAWVCEYYAEHAESMLADEVFPIEHAEVRVVRRPIGVLYAVMPWNFPFWQVFRAAAPNLMAGNAMVLKHAPNTMGCGADITSILSDAGGPDGLFADLPIDVADSPSVIRHPSVRGVTLTGSDAAGRAVASEAGAQLKKCVMELGGSDPYVVLADADIELAADRCVSSRMLNCGQVCIAAKRLIVVDAVYDQFEAAVLRRMSAIEMRDPMDEASTLGPMAREDLRDHLHSQVQRSLAAGASCLLGGEVPNQAGWWYPPTVLAGVAPGMPAFDEEMFGPVACLVQATDADDAIRLADGTSFGLAGAVFTNDAARGTRIACNDIDAGCVAVNDFVRSDPRVPFGGARSSGFGRELGCAGIHEFVNLKSVVTAARTDA
ncbi:MAG: NAD-dependent succinate-semialdehyde dehydrogenase [Phycisphaerales bacterium]|nr:NAD-dependent succinate-semialdehyde dehydrogenase [Phycisphaerales bacterium]